MNRPFLLVAALLAALPAALAHPTYTPDPNCSGAVSEHDYVPSTGLWASVVTDGNLADCAWTPVAPGPLAPPEVCSKTGSPPAPLCRTLDPGVNAPAFDYDGEPEWGVGRAVLFYDSGDGITYGVIACYGAASQGHHAGDVHALSVLGNGPWFTVSADWSRASNHQPDCGDGIIEPCDPTPPTPSGLPFPANVAVDTVFGTLYSVFGPGGIGCNALDRTARAGGLVGAPSTWTPTFGPGADGAYIVTIEQNTDSPMVVTAGHVWTL